MYLKLAARSATTQALVQRHPAQSQQRLHRLQRQVHQLAGRLQQQEQPDLQALRLARQLGLQRPLPWATQSLPVPWQTRQAVPYWATAPLLPWFPAGP